ncbi:MAG TPA: hypothetical protein VMM60_05470 [Ilumatobacter sp.]|nr:hypothetical protein [Ilumatobacter sp.]
MLSWNAIFGDLDPHPVLGQPETYAAAAAAVAVQVEASADVHAAFARIASSAELTALRGGAVGQLAELVRGVDESLGVVPPMFSSLQRLFVSHADQLSALHRRAGDALALANTRHDELLAATEAHAAAAAALRTIDAQLWYLHGSVDDPFTNQLIEQLEADRRWAHTNVAARASWVATADEQLALSRIDHHRLTAAEEALVAVTIAAIRRTSFDECGSPADVEQLDSGGLEALCELADQSIGGPLQHLALAVHATMRELIGVHADLPNLHAWGGSGGGSGDRDGTYTARISSDVHRRNLTPTGGTPNERALDVIVQALAHTDDQNQIWHDEFELVKISRDRYIVVLPGVVDLSQPQLGLNPHHRSARDTDQFAVRSARSTGMGDNVYAQMVHRALALNGVPPGADVMLVGHSFGADTALDLAADPRFNGPGAFHVTHALVAGYHSRPQIPHVRDGTEVLALQNTEDLVVRVEQFGEPILVSAELVERGVDRLLDGNLFGGLRDLATGATTLKRIDASIKPGIERFGDGQHLVAFAGGDAGRGHRPSNYTDYLGATNAAVVTDFVASVATSGYGSGGTVTAIDISVPRP